MLYPPSSFSEGRGGFYAPAEKVRLHTMIALLKSGPGATHTAMIDHHFNSDEGISKLVKVRLGIDLFILNKTVFALF